jgi:uncharacterized protein YifE (UPF0438 family)
MADLVELAAHDRHVIETGRFTEEERSLLRRHLPAYRRLVENTSLATNERRVRFLQVVLRDAEPRTPHEIAFKKFLSECERLRRDQPGQTRRSPPKPRQITGRRARIAREEDERWPSQPGAF